MLSVRFGYTVIKTVVLGCATYVGYPLLCGYVIAHLPLALCHSAGCLLLLPGLISAVLTGLVLAMVASLVTPQFSVVIPTLATLPWVLLHVSAWVAFSHWGSWWVVLSDVTSLVTATLAIAIGLKWLRSRWSASKRTRVPRGLT